MDAKERVVFQEARQGGPVVDDVLSEVEELVQVEVDDGRVEMDVPPRPGQHGELRHLRIEEEGGDLRAKLEW